jgi:thiamine biosynthesis protein ThiI
VEEKILDKCSDMKVKLKEPENEVHIEVRNARAFVFSEKVKGVGGMPVGTQGDVTAPLRDEMDLLAIWMMLKRGCRVYLHDAREDLVKTAIYWGASLKEKKRYLAEVTGRDEECLKKSDMPVFCPLIGLNDAEIEERMSIIFS